MSHHAYYITGDLEKGARAALSFIEQELGLDPQGPDVKVERHNTFSVTDAQAIISFDRQAPVAGNKKAIVISTGRFYVGAQNALLKLFEEPNIGTTLFLAIPSEAILLPTLRSRMVRLPEDDTECGRATEFLALSQEERKKYIDTLLAKSKGEREEMRDTRQEALFLGRELTRYIYTLPAKGDEAFMREELLRDLSSFNDVLNDASASLKPIFEHLLLVLPPQDALPRPGV